jgi:hypothetical protein
VTARLSELEARAAGWILQGSLVAAVDGEIVGWLHVRAGRFGDGGIGLGVGRAWRGRGVGSGAGGGGDRPGARAELCLSVARQWVTVRTTLPVFWPVST